MNQVDKKILLGVAIVTGVTTLRYGWTEEPMPFKVPGLNVLNTKKLVAAVAVITTALLVAGTLYEHKKTLS